MQLNLSKKYQLNFISNFFDSQTATERLKSQLFEHRSMCRTNNLF